MDAITSAPEMNDLFSNFSTILSSGILATLLLFVLLPRLSAFILTLVGKWQIFEKAGEDGWKVLIPFYGRFCFYELIWDNGWYFLPSYIPGLNAVFHIITLVKLSCCFDKSSGFVLGLVFFEPLFLTILGFDDSDFL